MKILSWNVNGIRAIFKKGFLSFIQNENPDILCIQETKAFFHQIPAELKLLSQYHICWHAGQRPGYAGTAIFSKEPFVNKCNTFDHSLKFHEEGRITEVEVKDSIILINVYFPNGGTRANGQEMLSYKLSFYDELESYIINKNTAGYDIILTGDFNIAHTEKDIARPKENENSIGFLPIERERLSKFIQSTGLTDVFRYFYPDARDEYTRRSYRAGARPRNVGRRLDYFMISPRLIEKVQSIRHRQDIMGSDHCPIELTLY